MGMNIVASDLRYMVEIANRDGRMAVIEDQGVAIFTPVCTDVGEGFHHVGFHIDHVQTIGEARAVLRSARPVKHGVVEHGRRGLSDPMTRSYESA